MEFNVLSYIYGLCTMFYALMAWTFWRKSDDMLPRLVAVLMGCICAECFKDLAFYGNLLPSDHHTQWMYITALDMIAVPFYGYILVELCRPGWLTLRRMVPHALPFVVLPLLLFATGLKAFFFLEVGIALAYGIGCAVWTLFAVRRYNKLLRERFSYDENINLKRLRVIMVTFFCILLIWTADCLVMSLHLESAYMLSSMVGWMFICYFIYRHESVVSELGDEPADATPASPDAAAAPGLDTAIGAKIEAYFAGERAFLNPKLKLSDVARSVGTNRTYVSLYFNRELATTFYEYVNNLRVDYACRLLRDTADSLDHIAARSGFNSMSTFHRVFIKSRGITPAEYRNRHAAPAVAE